MSEAVGYLLLAGQVLIALALVISAGGQVQAWAHEEKQLSSGASSRSTTATLRYWLSLTRSVVNVSLDEHPGRAKYQRYALPLVVLAWTYLAALAASLVSFIALVAAVVSAGITAYGVLCVAMAPVLAFLVWFVRFPSRLLGWLAAFLLLALGIGLLILPRL